MVAVNSTMLPLGTVAPDIALPDADGVLHTLDATSVAPATVVVFLSNHCPYVHHVGRELGLLSQQWMHRGVVVLGVMSNDTDAYPDDAPEHMGAAARRWGWDFPYLVDADQSVAIAYRAACTPDFFVFDADRRLVYRGRFDASRPGNDVPVTGSDLRAAVEAVLGGGAPTDDQWPSMGCNVKWRPGNEPEWFG